VNLVSRTRGAGLAGLLLLVTAACSSSDVGEQTTDSAHTGGNAFGHVHGLGVNPADDRLYVAAHMGVFRQTDRGFERIANRWQDTMAFTVAGPDHFLASGHPDTREDKPPHLGLVESKDAARTWTSLSLEGEADFHSLEIAGERIFGFDSQSGTLMFTQDGRSWTDVLSVPLLDVEANPGNPSSLLATDQRGELMWVEVGRQPKTVAEAPQVGVIDWPVPDRLVGLGPAGEVWVSRDGGGEWSQAGAVPGSPQALTADGATWYAASDRGLFSSTDDGATWEPVPQA